MTRTKIDWADYSWNPVTGCYHDCPYCYARRIAERFGGYAKAEAQLETLFPYDAEKESAAKIHEIGGNLFPLYYKADGKTAPFPFKFEPTLNFGKLYEPAKMKKPQTIFVGSMTDLFGDWTPNEWIKSVFDACKTAPWHRYLFLTKNPARYGKLYKSGLLPKGENFWFGASATDHKSYEYAIENLSAVRNNFISAEPLLGRLDLWNIHVSKGWPKWLILGAETGNRKKKVIPNVSWIQEAFIFANDHRIPVFTKDSLSSIIGKNNMRMEYPW